jgi:AmiR/NasT family two-component response regulator
MPQFDSALGSRDIIGQAKGMIIERFDLDAVAAFSLLAKLSQERNKFVNEIARHIVHRDHPRA